jgi:hypothetical protein
MCVYGRIRSADAHMWAAERPGAGTLGCVPPAALGPGGASALIDARGNRARAVTAHAGAINARVLTRVII